MLALYLVDPAWGTNEDYLKALLWGGVISEGVAYVAAILARTFPGTIHRMIVHHHLQLREHTPTNAPSGPSGRRS